MRVLVTGASGFVGKEIVAELRQNNLEVIEIGGRKSLQVGSDLTTKSNYFSIDIADESSFSELERLTNIDAIIHSAGLAHQFGDTRKEEFDAVNVIGTRNVADLAAKLKVKHFILIGSTAVYGIKKPQNSTGRKNHRNVIDEESLCCPQTIYAESKLEAEQKCREICEMSGIPLTIFRLAPVLGEGNVGNMFRLIQTIDNGRFIWIGKGSNLKALIYRRDVARACYDLLKKKKGGTEIFNLAAEPILMQNLVRLIAEHLGKRISNFSIPAKPLEILFDFNASTLRLKKIEKISQIVDKWLCDDIYSAKKIKAVYKFQISTPIEEALKIQVDWYKKTR